MIAAEPAKNRHWLSLEPADLRCLATPEISRMTREMVRCALHRDDRAARKLAELFRSMFMGKISSLPEAVDAWWQRKELANDFLTFLLTGVRPSLRARGEERKVRRGAGDNSKGIPPLENWLASDSESLWAFVTSVLANLSVDLIRRSTVQERWGSTKEPGKIDSRVDADTPDLPTPRYVQSSMPEAEKRLIEAEEAKLYLNALETLSERERSVITSISDGVSQAEIALQFQISDGRVSQLKTAAITKLRAVIALFDQTYEAKDESSF